jgi:hypothetical protein
MKNSLFLILPFLFFSCNQQAEKNQVLQNKIDSLEIKLSETYKPGFGEFMSAIQIHHAKLWFAGQNKNWELADFEINEIKENLEGIQQYCKDRPETKSLGIIDQAMDSISNSIQQKNQKAFQKDYINLTNSCNTCHQETKHGYNVIKIPETPPFSNQDFRLNERK